MYSPNTITKLILTTNRIIYMPIFGRKKEIEEVKEAVEGHPEFPEELRKEDTVEKLMKKVEKQPVEKEPERPAFAPLFVKIDRYRHILNTLQYMKTTMNLIKNTFSVLNELEKIRAENIKLIQNTIEKVDKKLLTLDSEFMRPSGFIEEIPEVHDVEGLESTLVELRNQVNQLKAELQSLS